MMRTGFAGYCASAAQETRAAASAASRAKIVIMAAPPRPKIVPGGGDRIVHRSPRQAPAARDRPGNHRHRRHPDPDPEPVPIRLATALLEHQDNVIVRLRAGALAGIGETQPLAGFQGCVESHATIVPDDPRPDRARRVGPRRVGAGGRRPERSTWPCPATPTPRPPSSMRSTTSPPAPGGSRSTSSSAGASASGFRWSGRSGSATPERWPTRPAAPSTAASDCSS